jgi:anaerobic ribonucleoside-triphosphate reductase
MRYYFHLVNDNQALLDDMGVEVLDLEEAKAEALNVVSELRQETDEVLEDWSRWQLEIVCSEGSILHAIPLARALH